jgi:hypothetical protein
MALTGPDTKRCDNLACLCEVPLTQATCSEFCASPQGRDPADLRCACGHAGCEEVVESQLHGGIGKESL